LWRREVRPFKLEWRQGRDWLERHAAPDGKDYAHCSLCRTTFQARTATIKDHENSAGHTSKLTASVAAAAKEAEAQANR
jgi:hypothetical protein